VRHALVRVLAARCYSDNCDRTYRTSLIALKVDCSALRWSRYQQGLITIKVDERKGEISMTSSIPLQGTELIDCVRANGNKGIAVVAQRCGYHNDIALFEQELKKAGEAIGVEIQSFNHLVDTPPAGSRKPGIEIALKHQLNFDGWDTFIKMCSVKITCLVKGATIWLCQNLTQQQEVEWAFLVLRMC
jgi:hypothetical protein